jgi:predicted GNAT family acetyltransferase
MMLAVYAHTPASRRFYERLGFEAQDQVTQMRLPQAAMRRLMGEDG